MIDDFVKRPDPDAKEPDEEHFFPDLSQQDQDTTADAIDTIVEAPADTPKTDDANKQPVDETIAFDNEAGEEIADDSSEATGADSDDGDAVAPVKTPKSDKSGKPPKRHRLRAWFAKLSKKQKIAAIVALVAIMGAIGFGVFALVGDNDEPVVTKQTKKQTKAVVPNTVASTLTGRQVDPSINQRGVTAVMIENSTDARPQAGLQEAGVVFEAIAEAGITRFVALYQDTDPADIGPVRSSRPYYLDWVKGFDASYAHVGGSPEALQKIRNIGIKDMDQSFNASYFQRVTDRYAPHNVFTSIAQLRELEKAKGYDGSNFTGFARTTDKDAKTYASAGTEAATTIAVNISSNAYNSTYTYDAASKTYARNMAGAPHLDKNGKQISPSVVVALVMPYSKNGIYSVYGTLAGGQAYIFQNGTVTVANWQKSSIDSQITFTDDGGRTIGLVPGQTWITAIGSAGQVTHQP